MIFGSKVILRYPALLRFPAVGIDFNQSCPSCNDVIITSWVNFKGPLQPKIFISEHDVIRPPENESVIIFFISLTVL